MQSDEPPLWQNFRLLAGIDKPRRAFIATSGIVESKDRRHEQQTILTTEDVLHAKPMMVLRQIKNRCGLGDAWSYQRLFFKTLLRRFFAAGSDHPAWVVIIPQRRTMQFRQEQAYAVRQMPGNPNVLIQGSKLWEHKLTIGVARIPLESLILIPKRDCHIRETSLVHQKITRILIGPPVEQPFRITEEWCYLASPGDAEDAANIRAGRVPALRQFYDDHDHIQRAVLVDLCKLSRDGRRIDSLTFHLHPDEGKVLDLRASGVPFEFYLRAGASSHAILRQAVTPGGWETV